MTKQIFRVLFFRRFCKIEGAGYDGLSVNDHNFVMGYGMGAVDSERDTLVVEEGGRRIFLSDLTLV